MRRAIISLDNFVRWQRELRRRWPLLVGVLRGKTVIFAAKLGPPQEAMVNVTNPKGAVVIDTSVDGGGLAAAGLRVDGPRCENCGGTLVQHQAWAGCDPGFDDGSDDG